MEGIQLLNSRLRHHFIPIVMSVFLLFIAVRGGGAFDRAILDYKFPDTWYPIRAAEFLKENPISGNMYNSYSFGGYLIYRFFPDPRYRVFVDGRAIVGGEDYFKEYLKVARITPEWKETLEKYQVNWIIERADSSLSMLLLRDQEWKLIYADEVAHIFVQNAPQNQLIIRKHPNVKSVIKKKGDGTS